MRSICKKVEIKTELLIVFFLAFISGLFKDVLSFFLIIMVHELGHVISSLLYGWKIKKVSFGVCGGFITYDDVIDKSFKEEFLIAISGFLLQTLFYLIAFLLYKFGSLTLREIAIIKRYHNSILLFNLLPIVPLDGSKIINVLLNVFISYKASLKITSIISFISVFLVILYFLMFGLKIEISYIMILCFLFNKIIAYYKDIPHLFNRFLFEKYSYPNNYKKIKVINGLCLEKLRRQRKHVFIMGKKHYTEKEILLKIFD